jgi:hypothetical protein
VITLPAREANVFGVPVRTPNRTGASWLLAQGDDIAPIPGTKRVSRVEENTAADGIELSAEQLERLNNLTPAAGERHEETQMAVIDRRPRPRGSAKRCEHCVQRSRFCPRPDSRATNDRSGRRAAARR